jgi:cysteine desulfurase
MSDRHIYLDHAATTPLDPEVFLAMEPFLQEQYGNPSSSYSLGREARSAVDRARTTIAGALNCKPSEVVFTAGGTESINLALQGVLTNGGHLVSSSIEHAAVRDTVAALEKRDNVHVTMIAPTEDGGVGDLLAGIDASTTLVSLMIANNEIGTIYPIADIARAVKSVNPEVLFHTDACQATGYIDLDVQALGVDLLSINASKIYGPKGVGALYVKSGVQLEPLMYGGGQERSLRPGTENVAGIVGFARAVELSATRRKEESARQTALRDQLIDGILGTISGTRLNGTRESRLPNNVNIFFDGVEGEALLFSLDSAGIFASMGSACAAGSLEPSHVLTSIGLSKQDARRSIRFTLGRTTTAEDIDHVLSVLPPMIERLRYV